MIGFVVYHKCCKSRGVEFTSGSTDTEDYKAVAYGDANKTMDAEAEFLNKGDTPGEPDGKQDP